MKKYFLSMLIASYLSAFTVGDAVKEIRLATRDSAADTNNRRWTSTELYRRIELAQNAIIRKSGCLEAQANITTIANQSNYAVASDCIEVRRVEFTVDVASNSYMLVYLSKRKLDTMNKDWKADTGKPMNWTDVLFSSAMITIYKRPTSTYAVTNGITYNYIKKMPAYSTYSDTSTLFENRPMLQPYYMMVVYYVARLCMVDNRNWVEANNFKMLYDEELILLIGELNSSTVERQIRRPPVIPPIQR